MPGNPLVRFDEGRVGRTARCRLLSYSTVLCVRSIGHAMRVMPSLINATLKLMSNPKRLSASRKCVNNCFLCKSR